MFAYICRRVLYSIPILVGVNLLIFFLFFFVNSPRDMAETIIGDQRVTPERVDNWLEQHNYHLPRLFNADEKFPEMFTQTIFWQKNVPLFLFRFGKSDTDDASIGDQVRKRIRYSLYTTVPTFIIGLVLGVLFAMIVAFYRGTYVDTWALFVCVIMMSISPLFYIVGGQYLVAIHMRLTPVSGFDEQMPHTLKFLVLPILVMIIGGIGSSIRYYRTIFLEEINKDYVRTARAKGLTEGKVLFKHALRNAMIPVLTSVVVSIPFLIMGSLLIENFFGIPGLGSYLFDAISKQDFAVIRAMVFLMSVLYVWALIFVDISYTLADPRVRLR